jgi:sensor histidine kinase YesM
MAHRTNISLYWKIQVLTWSLAAFYWGLVAFLEGNFIWSLGLSDFILDVLIGISLSHCYRNFARYYGWHQLKLKKLVLRIFFSVLVLSVLYVFLTLTKLYCIRWIILGQNEMSLFESFRSLRLQVFITGTRLMSIWILAFHLYHYAIREIDIAKDNARLSMAVKEAQLNQLTAQLNPHFLFNALNNIKFLVSEQPQSARRAIDLLADLLRNSLHTNKGDMIPLHQEFQLVKDFLELEKMRFEERLEITMNVDPDLLNHLVLPLSIQTLVENAVKHGIENKRQKGFIHLKIYEDKDLMCITVQNSGHLDTSISNSGIGLKNLKERLCLHYNGKANFEIKMLDDNCVEAKILIPIL